MKDNTDKKSGSELFWESHYTHGSGYAVKPLPDSLRGREPSRDEVCWKCGLRRNSLLKCLDLGCAHHLMNKPLSLCPVSESLEDRSPRLGSTGIVTITMSKENYEKVLKILKDIKVT